MTGTRFVFQMELQQRLVAVLLQTLLLLASRRKECFIPRANNLAMGCAAASRNAATTLQFVALVHLRCIRLAL